MAEHICLKVGISIGAIGVIIARLVWPDLKVDIITLGLVVVAILRWLSGLIESAKLPGGWESRFGPCSRLAKK